MDRCTTEYRALVSGYIDGDLDEADRQRLLAHMATCDDCRRTLEAYRRVGSHVRSLPRTIPPPDLRDSIYAATIRSRPRKVYLLSSRLGYTAAALAAVLLIFVVAVYLLVNGYQRSIDPEVVASQPGNGVLWPLSRPIEITFNKEMDRESVEAALSILPASEKDRLTLTWNGNTVTLGENQTLRPASSYSLLITTTAQDKWGSSLGSEFRLQFETSDSFALLTPEPVPSPTSTFPPTATAMPTPTPAPQVTSTPDPDPPQVTATEIVPTVPEIVAPSPTADVVEPLPPTATAPPAPTSDGPPAVAPTSTPTATATTVPTVAPSATATSTPTQLPTATAAPTWTPRPIPSATPTATEPVATVTPDTVPVVGAFGNVYWTNEIVQSLLGAPAAAARSITGVELDFQHGAMISRSDTSQTYVLESAIGVWSVVPSSSESTNSEPGADPDTWIPGGSLGALWSTEAWIQSSLGFALAPSGSVFESRVQTFERGTMLLSSSGQVYVIYGDGTWELYPDPGA